MNALQWFNEMFDHVTRDGREADWRTLCESEQPELRPLPEGMDDLLTPLQRALIIRAVRGDRLLHLTSRFVESALGKGFETLSFHAVAFFLSFGLFWANFLWMSI